MRIEISKIPRGNNAVTSFTMPEIYNLARSDCFRPNIIDLARRIIVSRKINVHDSKGKADAFFFWIKEECRFFPDPTNVELIRAPRIFLANKYGDCDDFVTALLCLNMSAGNVGRVVAIATRRNLQLDHVYLEIFIDGRWVSYDPVLPVGIPGIKVSSYFSSFYENGSYCNNVNGFFDKIFKEIKRFHDRIEKNVIRRPLRELKRVGRKLVPSSIYDELKRFESSVRNEVKRAARNIREEMERFSERVNKEFARWQEELGPFSQFIIVGLKTTVAISTGGLVLHAIVDSPFALTSDEWSFFVQLGLTIASAIITFVSAGAASALLASSVMQLASTTISIVELNKSLEERREAIKKLKKFVSLHEVELRVKREAIRKLEKQIILIERIKQKKIEYGKRIELMAVEHEMKVKRIIGVI